MKNFLEAYKRYKVMKSLGSYRLCWVPYLGGKKGLWSVIEFFDEELSKLDKNKVEVVLK